MDSIFWNLKTNDAFETSLGIIIVIAISLILYNADFIITIALRLAGLCANKGHSFVPNMIGKLSAVVIIPSLLRNQEDYDGIISAVESCATNGYPNDLYIIASVDGRHENDRLYDALVQWISTRAYENNVHLYVSSNEVRQGKIMAIESGSRLMQELVSNGTVSKFPDVYISVDADTTLSDNTLEKLIYRLSTPHPITGNLRKAVAGNICVRPDEFWQGWRKFCTLQGQIYINVARQFLAYSVHRQNWNLIPLIGLPGLLYCTWSDVLIQAPRYMGFLQTVQMSDWFKWMVGGGMKRFSDYTGDSLPEALCGSTDDTSISCIVSLASWRDGKLTFDAPATPLHAIGRILREWFIERSCNFVADAKGFTFVPPTVRGLWLQRIRWSSCRIECGSRFTKAFAFHWETASPFLLQLSIIFVNVLITLVKYAYIPFVIFGKGNVAYGFFVGFMLSFAENVIYTTLALLLDRDRKIFWPVILCTPVVGLFRLVFSSGACTYGVWLDVFWKGCNTRFVPQETLIRGRSQRIAIAFRVQRFLQLCWRGLAKGDVEPGWFWFSWYEKPEYGLQNGFANWTSGKKSSYVLK